MRKLVVAFIVIIGIWGSWNVAELGGVNASLQTGDIKVCRVAKMMTMEGGVCQWYCWQCDSGPPSGEVNVCSAGPGGCSGTFGCFTIPPQAPGAPPVKDKAGAAPSFAFQVSGKSGQTPDPNNNVGKAGLKKLKKKPSVTENDGTVIDRAVLRFRSDDTQPWRKAYVCLVKYDPPDADKPCIILGCGREISADSPNTPHELESMQLEEVPDLPFLVEVTVGAVTYLVALHEKET